MSEARRNALTQFADRRGAVVRTRHDDRQGGGSAQVRPRIALSATIIREPPNGRLRPAAMAVRSNGQRGPRNQRVEPAREIPHVAFGVVNGPVQAGAAASGETAQCFQ